MRYSDKDSGMEGFPMKSWSIEVYLIDDEGNLKPAKCFTKVTYNLHPSFEKPQQSKAHRPLLKSLTNDHLLSLHGTAISLLERGLGRV